MDAPQRRRAPEGWYPTQNQVVMRWWDGDQWTDQFLAKGNPMSLSQLRRSALILPALMAFLTAAGAISVALRSDPTDASSVTAITIVIVLGLAVTAVMLAVMQRGVRKALSVPSVPTPIDD